MTLNIYCYDDFEDRLNVPNAADTGVNVYTEVEIAKSVFLMPSKQAARKVLDMYSEGELKVFVTANGDLLNHILNIVVEENKQEIVKVFWYSKEGQKFEESVLNEEGFLTNWCFGYLY